MSQHTDVLALNGRLGGPEAQTNVLVPSPTTLARPSGLDLGLAVEEDCIVVAVVSLNPVANSSPRLAPVAAAGPRKNSLCGCFWKARSLWTVSSVAILSVWRGPRCALSTGTGGVESYKFAAPEFCQSGVDFWWLQREKCACATPGLHLGVVGSAGGRGRW